MECAAPVVELYFQHTHRLTELLNFQVVVCLGVLGFVIAEPIPMASKKVRILLAMIFSIFCFYALVGVAVADGRRLQLWTIMQSGCEAISNGLSDAEKKYLTMLKPTATSLKLVLQAIADLVVLIAIFSLHPRGNRQS